MMNKALENTFEVGNYEYQINLSTSGTMILTRADDNSIDGWREQLRYNFTNFVDEVDRQWAFEAIGNEWLIKFRARQYTFTFDYSDLYFARHLESQSIPPHLAVRLAIVAQGMNNADVLFDEYRKEKLPFQFNMKNGESTFEHYLKLTKALSESSARSIVKLKTNLEDLSKTTEVLLETGIHKSASANIGDFTYESLEAFTLFAKLLNLRSKQQASVISRILSEFEASNWSKASAILNRLRVNGDLTEFVDPSEKEYAEKFQYAESRQRDIIAGLSGVASQDSWLMLFSILIAKYGLKNIYDAREKVEETSVTFYKFLQWSKLPAFVVTLDYIANTDDRTSPLDWILLLSGDMDDENVELEDE